MYLLDKNGYPVTFKDKKDGKVITLQMTHDMAKTSPPCGTCPKIPVGREPHWDNAIEFEPWFDEVLRWYRESEAVGDFENPSGILRQLAGLIREQDRREEREMPAKLTRVIVSLLRS